MCELEGEGFISKVIARDLLQYVKNNDDIPKRTVNQAFQHVVNDTSPSSGPLPSQSDLTYGSSARNIKMQVKRTICVNDTKTPTQSD